VLKPEAHPTSETETDSVPVYRNLLAVMVSAKHVPNQTSRRLRSLAELTHMPRLVRFAARMLTGSTYVLLGLDAARAPGGRVDQAAPTLATVRTFIPLPVDDELVVRGNGAVQVLGGALLMLGKAQRLSAVALTGSLIPTTMAGHAFWTTEDPAIRKQQRTQFHKNMAMIGGLLFATLDQR
jgi:putative oxidoreductase